VWFAKYGLFSASKNASIVRAVTSPLSSHILSRSSFVLPLSTMPFRPVSTRCVLWTLRAYLIPIFPKFHVTPANVAYSCLGGFTVIVRPFWLFSKLQRMGLIRISAVWHVQLAYKRKGKTLQTLWEPLLLLSHLQLYIGEAIWAFLFGIAIGT